jgi:hypothetical protein
MTMASNMPHQESSAISSVSNTVLGGIGGGAGFSRLNSNYYQPPLPTQS